MDMQADHLRGSFKVLLWLCLPHGLGTNVAAYPELCRNKIRLFNQVEEYYKEWFQVPDQEVCTEAQQESFLREHPELEPRLTHSGHWRPGDTGLVSPPFSPANPQINRAVMGSFH